MGSSQPGLGRTLAGGAGKQAREKSQPRSSSWAEHQQKGHPEPRCHSPGKAPASFASRALVSLCTVLGQMQPRGEMPQIPRVWWPQLGLCTISAALSLIFWLQWGQSTSQSPVLPSPWEFCSAKWWVPGARPASTPPSTAVREPAGAGPPSSSLYLHMEDGWFTLRVCCCQKGQGRGELGCRSLMEFNQEKCKVWSLRGNNRSKHSSSPARLRSAVRSQRTVRGLQRQMCPTAFQRVGG